MSIHNICDTILPIFVLPRFMQYSGTYTIPEKHAQDKLEFLRSYLSISMRLFFFSDYIPSQPFDAMLESMDEYIHVKNNSNELATLALSHGFSDSFRAGGEYLAPVHIGLILSDNTRDEKFVMKSMTRLFTARIDRKSVPRAERPENFKLEYDEDLPDEIKKFIKEQEFLNTVPVVMGNQDIIRSIIATPKSQILFETDYRDDSDEQFNAIREGVLDYANSSIQFAKTSNRLDMALARIAFGDEIIPTLQPVFGECDQKDIDAVIRENNLDFYEISLCCPDYWEKLSQKNIRKKNREELADDIQHMMAFCMLRDQKSAEYLQNISDMHTSSMENSQQRIRELEQKLAEKPACVQADPALEEKLKKSERTVRDLRTQADRSNRTIQQMQQQINSLNEKLRIAARSNDDLNSQLLDTWAQTDDTDPEEQAMQLPGLKERLGEDVIQNLSKKRVIVACGHINTHITLRELFPNWEFLQDLRPIRKKNQYRADLVIILTSYCSHASFEAARVLAKSSGIPVRLCCRNSPLGVCEEVRTFFEIH